MRNYVHFFTLRKPRGFPPPRKKSVLILLDIVLQYINPEKNEEYKKMLVKYKISSTHESFSNSDKNVSKSLFGFYTALPASIVAL